MTQIQGHPNANIFLESATTRELSDNSSYRVGKDGSLKKANSVGTFFKETFSTETVKKQNQKTLDSLMRQLTQEYGSDSFNASRESLRVPEEVLSGKRAITGRDLKALAASVRTVSASKVQAVSGPLTEALKEVMSKENPTATEVIKTLAKNLPKSGSSQTRQSAMLQAVSTLDPAKFQRLQTILFSGDVNKAKSLFDQAVDTMTRLRLGEPAGNKLRWKAAEVLMPFKDSMDMAREALKTWGQVKKYGPPTPMTGGPVTWKNPDKNALALLESIGVGSTSLAKMDLKCLMPGQTADSVLRGNNDMSILILRNLGAEKLAEPIKGVQAAMEEMFLSELEQIKTYADTDDLDRLPSIFSGKLKTGQGPYKDKYFGLMAQAMERQPGLKEGLGECIAYMREHIEPIVREKFGDQTPQILLRAFNGVFFIGATASLSNEMMGIKDPKAQAAARAANLIFMTGMSDANLAPDHLFGKYMNTVPGWKEMTTMTPKP